MTRHEVTDPSEVTNPNTVKHWCLYTLDAIEAEEDEMDDDLNPRMQGVSPRRIYEYAAGDDSIVFRSRNEISSAMSQLARLQPNRPVNRRTLETDWGEWDNDYRYRMSPFGREALLELGVPEKLPNRRDYDAPDRELSVKPAHNPGWWREEHPLFSDKWDIRDNNWISGANDGVYFLTESDATMAKQRGYDLFPRELSNLFSAWTFVLTTGPYRGHDLMYRIRDPWKKVVQIDVYSPLYHVRTNEEITRNYEHLVDDLKESIKEAKYEP